MNANFLCLSSCLLLVSHCILSDEVLICVTMMKDIVSEWSGGGVGIAGEGCVWGGEAGWSINSVVI